MRKTVDGYLSHQVANFNTVCGCNVPGGWVCEVDLGNDSFYSQRVENHEDAVIDVRDQIGAKSYAITNTTQVRFFFQ